MKSLSVLLLDTEPRTHNFYITLGIADALRQNPFVDRVVLASHKDAIRKFVDDKLDTFIAFGGSHRHTDLLARICCLADLSILWTTEDPYAVVENVRSSVCFDVIFSNDNASVASYGGRAYHLPLAANPLFQDLPVKANEEEYLYDLLFIGTAWPNRTRSINRIISSFGPELKVKLALPWNEFTGQPQLDNRDLIIDWRCGNGDFARFANTSKVVLTLPRDFTISPESRATGSTPPPRLFETALAGGFQIIVSPEPEIRDYYDSEAEVLVCTCDDEAISLIRQMLADPERRMSMAARARARTLREHLYEHRIQQMLSRALAHRRSSAQASLISKKRKTVLFVSHNRQTRFPGGGVEIYQEFLSDRFHDHDVVFLFPTVKNGRTLLCVEGKDVAYELECATMNRQLLTDPQIESFFEKILFEQGIDVVHFHHLLHLPLSLPLIAQACGVAIVWQIHDYYLICDHYNLLNNDQRFCDVVNNGSNYCNTCLSTVEGYPHDVKVRRDEFVALVVKAVDAFIASSPSSGHYLRSFFHEVDANRINIIELPALGKACSKKKAKDVSFAHLNVAIPGVFNEAKGGRCLIEVMRRCADYEIYFKILGRADPYFEEQIKLIGSKRIVVQNGYDQTEIIHLMSDCDVSLHLSIWPETYMLSLTEAWQAGLVPIVTALGAPGERVTDGVDGFIVPPSDSNAAVACLTRLLLDRAILTSMREAVQAKEFTTPEKHVAAIERLYERLEAQRPAPLVEGARQAPGAHQLTLFDVGIRLNSPVWTTLDNRWDSPQANSSFNVSQRQSIDLPRLNAEQNSPIVASDADVKLLAESELFDVKWYLAENKDVRVAKVNPIKHYLTHGAQEGRDPGPNFSTTGYLARYAEVCASGINPLVHYLRVGRSEGFEVVKQVTANITLAPDHAQKSFEDRGVAAGRFVRAPNVSAAVSRMLSVAKWGKWIEQSRVFSKRDRKTEGDVNLAANQSDGLRDALDADVRLIAESELFDVEWYLAKNKDVAGAKIDPIKHYLTHGAQENRDPGPNFSTIGYLARYAEVRTSGINPLVHYLRVGLAEGLALVEPSAAELLRLRFEKLSPFPIRAVPARRRVTMVTDSINSGSLFGGVGTAMVFSALLAKRLDASLRILTTDQRGEPTNFRKVMDVQNIPWEGEVEFIYSNVSEGSRQVDCGSGDLFLTTSWWATHSMKKSVPSEQIVYLIQEDERMFYPYGDEHLLCTETISDRNLRYVVNSRLLFDHLISEGFDAIGSGGTWFEPAFPREHYFFEDKQLGRKLQFFFYARPYNARNLFYRGLDAIDQSIARDILNPEDWDFNFAGKDLNSITLSSGVAPRLLQNLDWEAYTREVRGMDLGLSLMYTPHPSYPPLDLAACGAVAVTNRFGRKTALDQYSHNIICADLDTESLVAALDEGVRLAKNIRKRHANYESNKLGRDWPASMELALNKIVEGTRSIAESANVPLVAEMRKSASLA